MRNTFYLFALVSVLGFSSKKDSASLNPQNTAVILVDMQNDFTEYGQGSLAVQGGQGTKKAYIKKVKNALNYLKNKKKLYVIGTQDWHPQGHVSFASAHQGKKPYVDVIYLDNTTHQVVDANTKDAREQRLWPDHCVQGTKGAQLVKGIDKLVDVRVHKGTEKNLESYSGFYKGFYGPDDKRNIKSSLDGILKKRNIKNVIVFGLANDFCVGATAKDGADLGYHVMFVKDLSEAVFGDEATKKVCQEMEKKGIETMTFDVLKKRIK
ncbi:MAG: isochorismatase family protein [Bacteroidota bacterium]